MLIPDIIEYYKIISPILKHDEFQKRKYYRHHGDISVYQHCLNVSKLSYKMAKKLKLDYKSAAIGGLLHDFYPNPWQENNIKKSFFEQHGFVHANEAKLNAMYYFPELVDEKVQNIIERHMFPLNKIPPKYKEGWIVTLADKYVSMEVFKQPTAFLQFFGYKRKVNKV